MTSSLRSIKKRKEKVKKERKRETQSNISGCINHLGNLAGTCGAVQPSWSSTTDVAINAEDAPLQRSEVICGTSLAVIHRGEALIKAHQMHPEDLQLLNCPPLITVTN